MTVVVGEGFLLTHGVESARALHHALTAPRAGALRDVTLEGMVRLAAAYPRQLADAWKECRESLFGTPGGCVPTAEFEAVRARLQDAFRVADASIRALMEDAARREQAGRPVPGADVLPAALDAVRRLHDEVFRHWPSFRDGEPGEYLDADEAFAQIAGVDREGWLRRVEERKRERTP
jgi:hypothetical protein